MFSQTAGLDATVVFDGRETMTLNVQPQTGGRPASTLNVKLTAILCAGTHNQYPAQNRFDGTETVTISVTRPTGASATLNLRFPAKTVDIVGDADVASKLNELQTYLDGVFAAAEAAAGVPPRLFRKPLTGVEEHRCEPFRQCRISPP